MRLVGSLLSPADVDAPIVSELDNAVVLAQIDSRNTLLLPSAFSNTGTRYRNKDIMCKTKLERELRH